MPGVRCSGEKEVRRTLLCNSLRWTRSSPRTGGVLNAGVSIRQLTPAKSQDWEEGCRGVEWLQLIPTLLRISLSEVYAYEWFLRFALRPALSLP